jgi:hypothetical protein
LSKGKWQYRFHLSIKGWLFGIDSFRATTADIESSLSNWVKLYLYEFINIKPSSDSDSIMSTTQIDYLVIAIKVSRKLVEMKKDVDTNPFVKQFIHFYSGHLKENQLTKQDLFALYQIKEPVFENYIYTFVDSLNDYNHPVLVEFFNNVLLL